MRVSGKMITAGGLGLVALISLFSAVYTVEEGHVGIVTRWSKAIYAVDPGLRFKMPLIDAVEHMEVRQRRNTEEMSAATNNQLPITAAVSINWTIHKEAAFDIFVNYGGLQQFENRILDPKFRQASKAALSKYGASQLIRERDLAAGTIQNMMVLLMEPFPVDVNSPQIENLILPPQYMEAVMNKERAREEASQEEYKLEKQKLEAQRLVQTANAERDAKMASADGRAYQVEVEAEAEAKAVLLLATAEAKGLNLLATALAGNTDLIRYSEIKQWSGAVPQTVLSSGTDMNYLMQLPGKQIKSAVPGPTFSK